MELIKCKVDMNCLLDWDWLDFRMNRVNQVESSRRNGTAMETNPLERRDEGTFEIEWMGFG